MSSEEEQKEGLYYMPSTMHHITLGGREVMPENSSAIAVMPIYDSYQAFKADNPDEEPIALYGKKRPA